jgi:hypothetical protein
MQDALPPPAVEAQAAHPITITGFGLGNARAIDLRRTPFSPADRSIDGEAALILEARRGAAVVRVRATTNDLESRNARLRLTEASVGGRPGDGWSFRIGKAQLSWDTGLTFQPVGFFQRELDFTDLGDFDGRGEGLPLVAVTYGTGAVTATIVASDRLDGETGSERRPQRQVVGRIVYDADGFSTSLILRQPSMGGFGVGGTATATLTDSITGYGSFYTSRGVLRGVAGGSILAPWNGALSVEYAHDGARGARGNWNRDNQLYAQATVDFGRLTMAAGARVDMDDGGVEGVLSAIYRVAGSSELRLAVVTSDGPEQSERGSAPFRSLVSLTFRRAF